MRTLPRLRGRALVTHMATEHGYHDWRLSSGTPNGRPYREAVRAHAESHETFNRNPSYTREERDQWHTHEA